MNTYRYTDFVLALLGVFILGYGLGVLSYDYELQQTASRLLSECERASLNVLDCELSAKVKITGNDYSAYGFSRLPEAKP